MTTFASPYRALAIILRQAYLRLICSHKHARTDWLGNKQCPACRAWL